MIDNIFKKPKDPKTYGNLFLERIPENITKVLAICVGYYDTLIHLMWSKPDIEFTVIDKTDSVVENLECTREITPNLGKTFGIQSEEEKDLLKELESIFKTLDIKNMLIIMNPPYGKSSSLSRKILNTILEKVSFEELVCLAPIKTNFDQWEHLSKIEGPFSLSSVFDISESNEADLFIALYNNDLNVKFNKTLPEVLLNDKQITYYKAVEKYNKIYKNTFTFLQMLKFSYKKKYEQYPEHLIFEIPIYTPANGVQKGGQTGEHNLQGKQIEWKVGSSAPWGVFCNTKEEFNNFSNWYYSHPYSWSRKRKIIVCIMDLSLSILYNLYGSGPSLLKYEQAWPNLDWSRSWTDEEIVQELKDKAGLPPDWKLEG